jgi:3-hydroxyacyl-CoA dehydrogenase
MDCPRGAGRGLGFEKLENFVEAIDWDPTKVRRDIPGFVWNRIQHALIRRCVHLVEEDDASIKGINRAIQDTSTRCVTAIGPSKTMGIVGLDPVQTVSDELLSHLSDTDELSPCPMNFLRTVGAALRMGQVPCIRVVTVVNSTARDKKMAMIWKSLSEPKE